MSFNSLRLKSPSKVSVCLLCLVLLLGLSGCASLQPFVVLLGIPASIIQGSSITATVQGQIAPGVNNVPTSVWWTFTLSSSCGGTFTATATPNNGPENPLIVGPSNAALVSVTYNSTGATLGLCTFSVTLEDASVANGLSATVSASATIIASCAPVPSGLVSWWPFEGNATDIQDGNTGSSVGLGNQFVPAKVGMGFQGGGQGSLIRVEDAANLDFTQFTIEAWIRFDVINDLNMYYVWKGDSGGTNITSPYGIGINGPFGVSISPNGIISGTPGPGKVVVTLSDSVVDHVILSNTTLVVGTFYHVALTADGSKVRIYINGSLDTEIGQIVTLFNSNFPLQIGSLIGALGPNFFPGPIDELTMYNRVLSAAEIQSIFNAGSDGKCK